MSLLRIRVELLIVIVFEVEKQEMWVVYYSSNINIYFLVNCNILGFQILVMFFRIFYIRRYVYLCLYRRMRENLIKLRVIGI